MPGRVLVTGASGFVGRAVVARLAQAAIPVRAALRQMPSAPMLDMEVAPVGHIHATTDWRSALDGVDAVVHCAARVHVMHETATDPLAAFREVNVAGTLQLARQAQASGVREPA